MIIKYCSKCEYHEGITLDGKLNSKCHKEGCLSIYSNCIANAAIKKFVYDNDFDVSNRPKSALETCYPLA